MIVTRAHACNCAVCGYALIPGTKAAETNGGLAHQRCVLYGSIPVRIAPTVQRDEILFERDGRTFGRITGLRF